MARGASERAAAAGLLPLSLYVTARTCFCSVGLSKAPRKPQRRIHWLPDAAEAAAKSLLGPWGRLLALCCPVGKTTNKASLLATNWPRKAVPTRPRAAHVRPWKSGDECGLFRTRGHARGTSVLQRPGPSPYYAVCAPLGCCADAYEAWVLFFFSLACASAAVPASEDVCSRSTPTALTRGVRTNTCRCVSSKRRKKIHQSKRVFPGQFCGRPAKGSKTKPNYRPKSIATNLNNISLWKGREARVTQ